MQTTMFHRYSNDLSSGVKTGFPPHVEKGSFESTKVMSGKLVLWIFL